MDGKHWIERVRAGELAECDTHQALEWLLDAGVAVPEKADLLAVWAARGESAGEIAALAGALRERSVRVPADATPAGGVLVDLCGTGGDGRCTFNVSTCASFVVAGAGVAVAKHGTRGATSKSGGMDAIEALGLRIDAGPEAAAACLKATGLCFLFAPLYHPAFKALAPVRKLAAERGSRTIFNLLGPLLNPARPTAQVVGVPDPALAEKYAAVMGRLGLRRGLVACGRTETGAPMDEMSTVGPTDVAEWRDGCVHRSRLEPSDAGFSGGGAAEFTVASARESAAIIAGILENRDRSARRDIVLLNAAAALRVAGLAEGWKDAVGLAREALESGAAQGKLAAVRGFFAK